MKLIVKHAVYSFAADTERHAVSIYRFHCYIKYKYINIK